MALSIPVRAEFSRQTFTFVLGDFTNLAASGTLEQVEIPIIRNGRIKTVAIALADGGSAADTILAEIRRGTTVLASSGASPTADVGGATIGAAADAPVTAGESLNLAATTSDDTNTLLNVCVTMEIESNQDED